MKSLILPGTWCRLSEIFTSFCEMTRVHWRDRARGLSDLLLVFPESAGWLLQDARCILVPLGFPPSAQRLRCKCSSGGTPSCAKQAIVDIHKPVIDNYLLIGLHKRQQDWRLDSKSQWNFYVHYLFSKLPNASEHEGILNYVVVTSIGNFLFDFIY